MSRYVMRYTGEGAKPSQDVQRLHDHPDIDVLDDTAARMLLVDGPDQTVRDVASEMRGWTVNPETTIDLPAPHPSAPTVKKQARSRTRRPAR